MHALRSARLAASVKTLYIIGEPGTGKSTLMAELTKDALAIESKAICPHIVYPDGLPWLRGTVAQLGRSRLLFPGTDTLSMGIQPQAISFVKSAYFDWLLAEGDRLANPAFFQACEEAGGLYLLTLTAPAEVISERLALRGSDQDQTWLAGRRTKVKNLTERYPAHVLTSDVPVEELARQVKELMEEVVHA